MSELWMKNQLVMTLKEKDGVPCDIKKIDNPELLPLCLKASCTSETFGTWMKNRNFPENREGLSDVEQEFGKTWKKNFNYASLSDQYWINMRGEKWKKINYFTNIYSSDIGNMFFKPWEVNTKKIDNRSPDLTLNGLLKKTWRQDTKTKKSYLVKAASELTHQEPLNEVLVSVLVEQLGAIKSAGYDLYIDGVTMCSRCENFIDENTELVPAHYIYYYKEKGSNETTYSHLLKMCELFDIPDAEHFLEWMIFIDNITGNKDRNLNNIAFIRDINTLKFLGPAPLYDCGNAYFNTKAVNDNSPSRFFGDVEVNIFNQLRRQKDLAKIFKKMEFEKLILSYPNISEQKKDNLIKAIAQKNNFLVRSAEVGMER